jgi:predicted RNase H-like HicB family nuclease
MKYVYPALLTPEDGSMLVSIPDLPGLHTFGRDVSDALIMAQDALEMWLWDAENKKESIPPASPQGDLMRQSESAQMISLIVADTDEYRRQTDTRAVKKTLSIPSWLNNLAEKANAPFSQILQQGLKDYLQVAK